MLTRQPKADMSKYEIIGILFEKGLTLRDISETCRLSLGWTHRMLGRLGYERAWIKNGRRVRRA